MWWELKCSAAGSKLTWRSSSPVVLDPRCLRPNMLLRWKDQGSGIGTSLPESAGSRHWRSFGESSQRGCPLVQSTLSGKVGRIIKRKRDKLKIGFLVQSTSACCLLLFAFQLLLSITLLQGFPHLQIEDQCSLLLVKASTSLTSSSSASSSVPCNCSTMKSEKSPRLAKSSS